MPGRTVALFGLCLLCSLAPRWAGAQEPPEPRRNWEIAAGFTPVSYGFYDALGGDGHFDTFSTVMAAGLEVGGGYRLRRYFLLGAHAEYLFALGRTDFWSKNYEPGVHRIRLGPKLQFRMPAESVQPFVELTGGFSALLSKNYGDSYRAQGVFAGLGLGANMPVQDSWGAYARYRVVIDFGEIGHIRGGYGDYLMDAGVVALLQEVTIGVFLQF